MKSPQARWRCLARDLAKGGAALSAVMLVLGVTEPLVSGREVALAAPINGGALQVLTPTAAGVGAPLNSGGSATAFALTPPVGAACTGDSVAGYRLQSYIVPASVDPSTLTFNMGPVPADTGANLRQPLVETTGTPWVDHTVGLGNGLLVGLQAFSFEAYGPGADALIPPGTYNLGFACTGPTTANLDKYWNVQFTFSVDPNDSPGGIKWVVVGATTTTTTTSTTTTTTVPAGSSTTSTTPRSTTTTSTSTTSTTSSTSTTTTVLIASSGTSSKRSSANSSTSLAQTGWSSSWLVVWAVLLIVFGRMAVLLGRSPKVRPPSRA